MSGLEPVSETEEESVTSDQSKKAANAAPATRKVSNGSNMSSESLGEPEGKPSLRKTSDASTESGILSSGSKNSDASGANYFDLYPPIAHVPSHEHTWNVHSLSEYKCMSAAVFGIIGWLVEALIAGC